MNKSQLILNIRKKRSVLCVGLDTDIERIPKHLLSEDDPVFTFNKAIIDATKTYAVAYKINTAFYESQGISGWQSLKRTLEYIPKDIFTIADAKRGDIGNTSDQYAKTFFVTYPFDAVTIAPYMGSDSITPFLKYKDKWAIVLGVTSNIGSNDFQLLQVDNELLYEKVMKGSAALGTEDNMMFVVGATRTNQLKKIRRIIPNHFLLIPGVGTQGGNLREVLSHTINADVGVLINVSRGIIFAGSDENFDKYAAEEARKYQEQMTRFITH